MCNARPMKNIFGFLDFALALLIKIMYILISGKRKPKAKGKNMTTNELNTVEILNPSGGTMQVYRKRGATYQIAGDYRTIEIHDLAAEIKACKEAKRDWAKLGLKHSY